MCIIFFSSTSLLTFNLILQIRGLHNRSFQLASQSWRPNGFEFYNISPSYLYMYTEYFFVLTDAVFFSPFPLSFGCLLYAGYISIYACNSYICSYRSCFFICFSWSKSRIYYVLCFITRLQGKYLLLFVASSQVVEIVDGYETACVPPNFRDNKVAYIQGPEDKTCTRTLHVSPLTVLSFPPFQACKL